MLPCYDCSVITPYFRLTVLLFITFELWYENQLLWLLMFRWTEELQQNDIVAVMYFGPPLKGSMPNVQSYGWSFLINAFSTHVLGAVTLALTKALRNIIKSWKAEDMIKVKWKKFRHFALTKKKMYRFINSISTPRRTKMREI